MSVIEFSANWVTFPVDPPPPYTHEDAGLRVQQMSWRWCRLDAVYDAVRARMLDLTDMCTSEMVADSLWPTRAARLHGRLVRLQAALDAEAANATERVYPGPRLLGTDGRWTFVDPNVLRTFWRRTQSSMAEALRESLVVPVDGERPK